MSRILLGIRVLAIVSRQIRLQCREQTPEFSHFQRFNPIQSRNYGSKASKGDSKSKKGGKHKMLLTDDEVGDVINVESLKKQLNRTLDKLRDDYVRTLSVRTSLGSIESLTVFFEGDKYPLNEVAQVVRKNPSLVVVNLSSLPTAIPAVLEAINGSGMNLNPQQDGTTLYLPIPQVTREHRETLSRNAKALFNKAKEDLRDTQSKYVKSAAERKDTCSEDLVFSVQQHITALTDDFVSQAETMLQKKQSELLSDAK